VSEPRIVADPDHCFGAPRLVGSRVPVHALVDRFVAGDTVHALAWDFKLTCDDVEEALRFGLFSKRQREKYLAGLDPLRRSDAKGNP
jgi:uncharacterized protein (DUF433 family)